MNSVRVMLIQWRTYCLAPIFLIVLMTFACASYPNEPKAPQVEDDSYVVEEDTLLVVSADIGILSNDLAREGERNYIFEVNGQKVIGDEPLSVVLAGGAVVLNLDGSFTYEPKKDFNGTDRFRYKVRNDKGKEGTGTCSFQVTPVNDPPLAQDDRISILPMPQQNLDVLANDEDPDGDMMWIVNIDDLENGSAAIAEDGMTISYTPDPYHMGDVSFSYTVADEFDAEAQAWVFLTNDDNETDILVQPDAITVTEDRSVTLPFGRLLANDRVDPDSDIEFSPARNGLVQANRDRTFTYSPNLNFTGTDSFIYSVETQGGITASTVVTVTVVPVEDAPFIDDIPNQSVGMGQTLGPVLFTVEDIDSPQDGLNVTATVHDAVPQNLVTEDDISIVGSGSSRAIWITPAPDLIGTATITITVSNGRTESFDSFELTVNPVPGLF